MNDYDTARGGKKNKCHANCLISRSCSSPRESSPRWPHFCSRAAISSAEGPQHSVLTQRRQSHAPNASPGFRRRRSQDHEAFLASCRALQTTRPRCVACTVNNLLLLLSMRAASAASSQRYAEQHRGLAPAARRIMSLSSYRVPHCRRLAHAESHSR